MTNKYIHLDKVLSIICGSNDKTNTIMRLLYVSPADTIEITPGQWIMHEDEAGYEYGVCSVCGFEEREHFPTGYTPKHCAECGVKMEGRKENGRIHYSR